MLPRVARSLLAASIAVCGSYAGTAHAFGPAEDKIVTGLKDAQSAVDAIWTTLPLSGEHAMFVSEKASIFGAYKPRQNSTFKAGETLLTYIEPVGYTWEATAEGVFAFGVSLDFEILTPDGKILGGQKSFLSYSAVSHAKVKELMLTASLNLDGFPAGAYVLHYTLRDLKSSKAAEIALPFKIAE